MSIDYLAAEDELFGVANVAWLAAVAQAALTYSPVLYFPGMLVAPPPVDQIYASCSFAVVKEAQATLGQNGGESLYDTVGLFALQVYSPKSDVEALRVAKTIALAVKDAFCKPSPSGEIWFYNQKLSSIAGNVDENQVNVIITCNYRTAK